MISSNPIPQVCNYGSSATYCTCPSDEQIANGVVPLDSLPAAWWNWMWAKTNTAVNCARYAAGVLIDEVNTVLTQAGVCVNPACVDQLYRAINTIRQTIGTADVAGAVKSSSTASEVAIDPTTGKMSVNCLGNAASLTTTATTVVGAINELKSTYDSCVSSLNTAVGGKAPTSHASSATTYGVGTASNYGHLKISDTYNSVNSQGTDVAASQKAAYCIYTLANGKAAVGSTAGCALGTAAAGTATTAARSDHVHPMPRTDQILDAATSCVAANAVCRKVIANNTICNVGYTTRVAIGLQRGTTGWGTALFSVGTNDAGTTFYDYKFSNAGLLTAACFCGALCGTATTATNVTKGVHTCQLTSPNGSKRYVKIQVNSRSNTGGSFRITDHSMDALLNLDAGVGKYLYGSYGNLASSICAYDCSNSNCFWLRYENYWSPMLCSADSFSIICNTATAPSGITFTDFVGYKAPNATNADYACCASYNGSGTAFGTAATCAATAFRASTWWPNCLTCGCVYCAATATYATCTSCFYYYSGSSLRGPVAFGTAARCSDTSFLAATGCAADSAKLGGTAASCYALKEGSVALAECAGSVYYTYIKGKWCCTCSPGPGIFCVRMYFCSTDAGVKIAFPGSCFTYTPKSGESNVAVAAQCVNITAASVNKWVATGPTYVVRCLDHISPGCSATGNIPSIQVY